MPFARSCRETAPDLGISIAARSRAPSLRPVDRAPSGIAWLPAPRRSVPPPPCIDWTPATAITGSV